MNDSPLGLSIDTRSYDKPLTDTGTDYINKIKYTMMKPHIKRSSHAIAI